MATILLLRKTDNRQFAATDEDGEEAIARIGAGVVVIAEIKKARNPRFHRKFFAMLKIVLDNQEHYKSIDDILDVCKLRVGHFKTIHTKLGDVQIPLSISFFNMGEIEFDKFYDKAVDWVCSEVIPGLDKTDLNSEVREKLMKFAA